MNFLFENGFSIRIIIVELICVWDNSMENYILDTFIHILEGYTILFKIV